MVDFVSLNSTSVGSWGNQFLASMTDFQKRVVAVALFVIACLALVFTYFWRRTHVESVSAPLDVTQPMHTGLIPDLSVEQIGDLIEPDLGIDTEAVKTKLRNALGYVTSKGADEQFFRWKLERYGDLIACAKKVTVDYLKEHHFEIQALEKKANEDAAPEWLKQIQPILQFCQSKAAGDEVKFDGDYLEKVRKFYNDGFLVKLRSASVWAREHPELEGADHVNGICHRFYTGIDLNHRCEEIFKTFLSLGEKAMQGAKLKVHPQLSGEAKYALINQLYTAHQLIDAVPKYAKTPLISQWSNSLIGHFNGMFGMPFDPNMQTNPVHVFFQKVITTKGGTSVHTVKDIAMGTPTIEQGSKDAVISPEFFGFLQHCEATKQVHLYFNNQNFCSKKYIDGNESPRCRVLHALAENEFKGTLHVVTLSQNSPFYEQTGKTSSASVQFKDELIAQMFDGKPEETGNLIPADLVQAHDLRKWSVQAVAKIHEHLFHNKEELTVEERRIFIRLFYRNLVRKILIETGAHSYNESCKDRIDRAATSDAEEYAYLAILNDSRQKHHVIQFFNMLVFARAIIVRKRTIVEERLERLIETVKFMIDHENQLKQLQAILFPDCHITIDQF